MKISFGSDAHCPNTPAYAFDQLEAYARSYGYTSSVIFENRKPREIGFLKIGRGEGPFLKKGSLSLQRLSVGGEAARRESCLAERMLISVILSQQDDCLAALER